MEAELWCLFRYYRSDYHSHWNWIFFRLGFCANIPKEGVQKMSATGLIFRMIGSLVFLVAFSGQTFYSASLQAGQWKGKIETKDGIKIVKNPSTPAFGEFIFDLEENLSIGGDPAEENYYFPRGASLNVDDKGNIYVCDSGNKRVQKYDKSGQYVTTIGRAGQGPGEYMFPSQVYFDSEGKFCVYGFRELVYFTPQGDFLRKAVLKASLNYFILGPKETIIGKQQPRPDNPVEALVQLSSEGDVIRTVAEFPSIGSERKDVFIMHWYSPRVGLAAQLPDSFWYGYSTEYKLYLADAQGQTQLIVTKDEKSAPLSTREKEATKEKGIFAWVGNWQGPIPKELVAFPSHRPFFDLRFLTDDCGRLYVPRAKSILDETKKTEFDIFSRNGFYLYKTSLDFSPTVIKNGYAYEVRSHEETGEFKIVRHRVKNWSELKTGI